MGAMLSMDKATVVEQAKPLHLRYGLAVHKGDATHLDSYWQTFAQLDLHPPFGPPASERDCLHGGHRRFNVPRAFASTRQCLDYVKSGK